MILDENYIDHEAALEMTGLQELQERRKIICLEFANKCLHHPKHKSMFPKKIYRLLAMLNLTSSEIVKNLGLILQELNDTESPPSHTSKGC